MKNAGHRQVSADGRQRQSQAQNQMAQGRKTFGITVAQYHRQRNGWKKKTNTVNKERGNDKQCAASNCKGKSIAGCDNALRNFADGSAWVECIESSVEETIERHSSAAGKDHAEENKKKFHPEALQAFGWSWFDGNGSGLINYPISKHPQKKTNQRKWQGENSMRKFNEGEIVLYSGHIKVGKLPVEDF